MDLVLTKDTLYQLSYWCGRTDGCFQQLINLCKLPFGKLSEREEHKVKFDAMVTEALNLKRLMHGRVDSTAYSLILCFISLLAARP